MLCIFYFLQNDWFLNCFGVFWGFVIVVILLPDFANDICQVLSRNLGMASKILPIPVTVVSDPFVGEFKKYLGVKQKLFVIFRCFLPVRKFYYFSFLEQNSGNKKEE